MIGRADGHRLPIRGKSRRADPFTLRVGRDETMRRDSESKAPLRK